MELAGRYRLEEYLGGTDTEVYRAYDEQLRRTVAVKIARAGAAGFEPERFDNEMRVLAGLRHPGLVTLHDAGVAEDRPYLVMQYVPGSTLGARIRSAAPADADIRRTGHALAGALAYLHAHGVVHRDVKPGNVLLGDGGEVYLADLGIARAGDTAGLTATGSVVGTPAYLAPEQVQGEDVGTACDLYSLGLVLLECFTGRREYRGTPVEAAMARLSRPPAIPADLPEPWPAVLAALTARDPAARPTAAALEQWLAAEPATRVLPAPARPRRRAAAVLAAAGTALVGGVVVAATWAGPAPRLPAPAAPTPSTAPGPSTTAPAQPAKPTQVAGVATVAHTTRPAPVRTTTVAGPPAGNPGKPAKPPKPPKKPPKHKPGKA
jgi:serine/threonine protein kinase